MSQQEAAGTMDLPGETDLGRYRTLFKNRNFRMWFLSAMISSLGDWAGLFALQTLVASLSASQSRIQLFSLGAIMMARTLPSLLFGPVAGVFADRYDRKRLMIGTDLTRAGLFVVIAFTGDLVALFALTFIVESMSLLFASSKDATLGGIVERENLTEANQLNLIVTYGTLPLGGLMGLLLAALSSLLRDTGIQATSFVLLLDAITFLVSAFFMSRLRLPPARGRIPREEQEHGLLDELREGLSFIRHMPVIRALITGVVGIFFGGGVIFALGPALLDDSDRWFTVVTLVGAGLVAGMVLTGVLANRFAKERLLGVFMTTTAGLACGIAVAFDFTTLSVLAFFLGVSAGLAFVMGYTLLHEQTYADDETRGTTFAAFYTGTRSAMFLALGVAPLVAGAIGRFSLGVGNASFSLSGLRITILAGGLLGLYTALSTMRALWGRSDDEDTQQRTISPQPRGGGRGLFIAFEGVEGSGKSTQISRLADALRDEGHEVVVTREPGGHPVSERIRQLLLDPDHDDMGLRTEALLYSAARAQLVDSVIQPALDDGKIVLSDRFVDSSLAYQGYARHLGPRQISEINQWATDGLRPDVVVWLRLDPQEGLRRVDDRARENGREAQRGRGGGGPAAAAEAPFDDRGAGSRADEPPRADGGRDRFEQEPQEFHDAVAQAYSSLSRSPDRRWLTVDAAGDPDSVAQEIRKGLERWLPAGSAQR